MEEGEDDHNCAPRFHRGRPESSDAVGHFVVLETDSRLFTVLLAGKHLDKLLSNYVKSLLMWISTACFYPNEHMSEINRCPTPSRTTDWDAGDHAFNLLPSCETRASSQPSCCSVVNNVTYLRSQFGKGKGCARRVGLV